MVSVVALGLRQLDRLGDDEGSARRGGRASDGEQAQPLLSRSRDGLGSGASLRSPRSGTREVSFLSRRGVIPASGEGAGKGELDRRPNKLPDRTRGDL